MPILVQIRPLVQPGRKLKEPKTKGEEKKLTVANWVFALRQRYVVLHAGGLLEVVLSFKFHQNR